MKKFEVPEIEFIFFNNRSVIATSTCGCDNCTICPDGKNNCPCVDSWSADYGN